MLLGAGHRDQHHTNASRTSILPVTAAPDPYVTEWTVNHVTTATSAAVALVVAAVACVAAAPVDRAEVRQLLYVFEVTSYCGLRWQLTTQTPFPSTICIFGSMHVPARSPRPFRTT